jgi:hypothetical protein
VTPVGKNGKWRCGISGDLLEGGEGRKERSPWAALLDSGSFQNLPAPASRLPWPPLAGT